MKLMQNSSFVSFIGVKVSVQAPEMQVDVNTLAPQILENATCQWQLYQQIFSLTSKSW